MRVGAHLRSGLRTAIPMAREVGAEVVQLFISNPRAWSAPKLETAEKFGAEWRDAKIGPIEFSVKDKETVNIPVWAGAGTLALGLFLLVTRKA